MARNNSLYANLKKLEKAEKQPTDQAHLASTNIDFFLASARKKMVRETRTQIEGSDALIAEIKADIAGCSFVVESGITAAAFAVALLAGYGILRAVAKREEKKIRERAKQGEPRERRIAQPMPDLAHARTEMKPLEKPPYYEQYHSRLSRKLKRQMGGNAQIVAEISLMVFPQACIHMIIDDPSEIGPCIGMQRAYYESFQIELLKRGLEPDDIFFNMDLPPKKPIA
jgi:hypothetical protein